MNKSNFLSTALTTAVLLFAIEGRASSTGVSLQTVLDKNSRQEVASIDVNCFDAFTKIKLTGQFTPTPKQALQISDNGSQVQSTGAFKGLLNIAGLAKKIKLNNNSSDNASISVVNAPGAYDWEELTVSLYLGSNVDEDGMLITFSENSSNSPDVKVKVERHDKKITLIGKKLGMFVSGMEYRELPSEGTCRIDVNLKK